MAGIYCQRCQTKTIPEQDGISCSNCGLPLFAAPPSRKTAAPDTTPPARPKPALPAGRPAPKKTTATARKK